MENKAIQNQIVIKTRAEGEKQRLPLNVLLSLAAGAITGLVIIFGLIYGAEKLLGL